MGKSKGHKKELRSGRNKRGATGKGRYYAKHRTGTPKAGPKSKAG